MIKGILELVTSSQIAIDAVDLLLTVFGEVEDWGEEDLSLCLNDVINLHVDMALGYGA